MELPPHFLHVNVRTVPWNRPWQPSFKTLLAHHSWLLSYLIYLCVTTVETMLPTNLESISWKWIIMNAHLQQYLFQMLGKLEDYLQKSKIPFYWDQRCNLIEHLGEIQIKNMCGRVTRLKRQLLTSSEEDCRSLVRGLFTP